VTEADRERFEQRVLLLAPTGKDAALTRSILGRAGVECVFCEDLAGVCEQLEAGGAGALLLAEEAVAPGCLDGWLARQPSWSDLAVLILARHGADSAGVARSMDLLGNVTVLERPTRVAALVSAVRTALRARQRQYQIRDQLEALQAKEAELQLVTETTPLILVRCSRDLRYRFANRASAALFGLTPKEMIGRPIVEVMGEEAFGLVKPKIDQVLRGEHVEFELLIPYSGAGDRWVHVNYLPDRDPQGRVVGWVASIADVTDRKAAEEALREADRRKDEFLAILAHELRNPLAPILNSLHILRLTSQGDPEADGVTEVIERQVNHMVRLVDDLMEVSRITRSRIELRKEPVEVAAIARSAVETSQPLIEAAGHRLVLSIPPEPLILEGDPVRLTQVVANLLNNAAKYTDRSGQIWLTVRREGAAVAISVRDSGSGIPSEMLPRVFDLFTQFDRRAGRAQGGLGIGLTLVKTLVEMHGGSVRGFSEGTGRGSEFVVRLPLAGPRRHLEIAAKEVHPSTTLAPCRFLVVDDNRDAAESLGTLLQLHGADVRVAYSGPEALEALATYRPSVVLLDIGMPGMDGHEVARRIRQRPELRDVALVALTGWGQEKDRHRSQLAGFDDHLVKPADISSLEKLLASLQAARSAQET
jgi:PAS domain S-box-containing protein